MTNWTKIGDDLAQLINDWNDVQYEENERSRGNDSLILVITEEGTGIIAAGPFPKNIKGTNIWEFVDPLTGNEPMALFSQCEFRNPEELGAFLRTWIEDRIWLDSLASIAWENQEKAISDLRQELIKEEEV